MKKILFIISFLISNLSFSLARQSAMPFALTDVRLLPSRFQRNMQRDKPTHFYAPFPGQLSADDFVAFYNDPKTIFARDLNGLYLTKE